MPELIYMDHAATTPLSPHALAAMMPYLTAQYANPSAVYASGRAARRAVEDARARVAAAIGAAPQEIYFTSGGTEADNWAIRAAAAQRKAQGRHILSTRIEHHAVLRTLAHLAQQGYTVTLLDTDQNGQVSPDAVRAAIRPDTVLITAMTANNEIGTILPVPEIGAAARQAGVLFHTDAVQAAGHIPLDVAALEADLLSLSGHKFGGPKGTGVLYMRTGLRLPPQMHGGAQERGLRAGTENVAGIVGLAAALEEAVHPMKQDSPRISAMRDRLIRGLLLLPGTRLTGDPDRRLPGIASFVFDGVEGEDLLLLLDRDGICASSGSACASGSLEPSHVLKAIDLPRAAARGALRLSLGPHNTDAEIDAVLERLPPIIRRLRGEVD